MAKEFIDQNEIKDLIAVIQDLFAHQKGLREQIPISSRVQFPKIPPILSESIAFHLIRDEILDIGSGSPKPSQSRGDIELVSRNGRIKRVEVKATALSAFQEFSEKDLDADLLIWMHFGDMFYGTMSTDVEVFVVRNPRDIFRERQKINLKRFKDIAKDSLIAKRINLGDYLGAWNESKPMPEGGSESNLKAGNSASRRYVQLHEGGLSIQEISKHCDRSEATIRDLLHGRGYMSTPMKKCPVCRPGHQYRGTT